MEWREVMSHRSQAVRTTGTSCGIFDVHLSPGFFLGETTNIARVLRDMTVIALQVLGKAYRTMRLGGDSSCRISQGDDHVIA